MSAGSRAGARAMLPGGSAAAAAASGARRGAADVAVSGEPGGSVPFDLTTTHIPPLGLGVGDGAPVSQVLMAEAGRFVVGFLGHLPPQTQEAAAAAGGMSFTVARGGAFCKLKGIGQAGGVGGGRRGVITMFSPESRKRQMQLLGSLDRARAEIPLFVGLTYPGEEWPSEPSIWKGHLAAFYKRVCRAFPACKIGLIWRLEPQERGAPHFHVLIFGVRFIPYAWIGQWWAEITGGNPDTCSRIERVRSWRGVMSYCSKYLAKVDDSRAFRDADGVRIDEVGRHWGVMGKDNLPTNLARYVVALSEFHKLRRWLGGYMRSKGRSHRARGRFAGVWCFCPWEDALKLLGLAAPGAVMIDGA